MKTTTKTKAKQLSEAERFFFANAGFSYNPQRETSDEGRLRCAQSLAKAEAWARAALSFEWSVDPDCDSSEFSDEQPAWNLWQCLARGKGAEVVAALGGIDFGRDCEPWGDSYKRTVEAELALEAMDDDAQG
jgi:hypothetical protein